MRSFCIRSAYTTSASPSLSSVYSTLQPSVSIPRGISVGGPQTVTFARRAS